MPLTFQQIILDAGKLVDEISLQEKTANNLIFEIESVCNQIDSMKQYQEDVDNLSEQTNQKTKQDIIAGFQKGYNGYFRELEYQNKDLRSAVDDYRRGLEQIMSKYRQQTVYFLKQSNKDLATMQNANSSYCPCKCLTIINQQAEKINEMASVMRTAAELDEDIEMKYAETLGRLLKENAGLREILNAAKKYDNMKNETLVESKTVQTDEM